MGFSVDIENNQLLAKEALMKGFEKCDEANLLVDQNSSEAEGRLSQAKSYFQAAKRLAPDLLEYRHAKEQHALCLAVEKRIQIKSVHSRLLEALGYCRDAKKLLSENKKIYSHFLQEKFLLIYRELNIEPFREKNEFLGVINEFSECNQWVKKLNDKPIDNSKNKIAQAEKKWKEINAECLALNTALLNKVDEKQIIEKHQKIKKALHAYQPEVILGESFQASSLAEVGVLSHYMNAYECEQSLDKTIAQVKLSALPVLAAVPLKKLPDVVPPTITVEDQFMALSAEVINKYEASLMTCERIQSILQSTLFLDKLIEKEVELKKILRSSQLNLLKAEGDKKSWDQQLMREEKKLQEITYRKLYEMGQWHERTASCLSTVKASLKLVESKKALYSSH